MRHLCAIVAISSLALLAQAAGFLLPLDNLQQNFRFRQLTREPTGAVVLVNIDAKSLAAVGQWPWPRDIHASIIDALSGLGAADIAVDIDFSTSSSEAGDLALELALERAKNSQVLLAAFNQNFVEAAGSGEIYANLPLPRFSRSAWPAAVNVRPDRDGTVRRFSLGERVNGSEMPSIPAVLGNYAGAVRGDFAIDYGINARAIDRISASDLLHGGISAERIAGKKVIYGASAIELRDIFEVPVYGILSGPTIQALATESILHGRMLKRTGTLVTLGGILLIGAVLAAARRLRWTLILAGLACTAIGFEGLALGVQRFWPIQVDTSAWQAAIGAYGLAMVLREIGLRRILLAISSTETLNTRTILAQVISDNLAGVVVADENGLIRAASRSAEQTLFPGSPIALVERQWREVLPPELAAALERALEDFRADRWTEAPAQELRYRPSGRERVLEFVVRPSRLSGGVSRDGTALPDSFVATLTFADVTERRQAEARLAYLARFDTLTGLPNRNQFTERLGEVCQTQDATQKTTAVLFFDLDRFKTVNDTLGHKHGDLVLRAVAERVAALIKEPDLAARFGGDEYAILHHSTGAEGAEALAQQLIRELGEPYVIEGYRLIIGASVGIAFVAPGSIPMEVMKNADIALYRAKGAGGNTFSLYESQMDAELEKRQRLELDLWDAFDKHQFEVHYQPQLDLATEELIGVEALVRWKHPDRGFVSPAEFIPVVEAVGLIDQLGAWVLNEACAAAASWPQPIKVAVNVSPIQFTRGDLATTVRSALYDSGLAPHRLDLEITESLFVTENPAIRQTMVSLRADGVSFSIDDFGTGYSSLSYIRKFPVQKLKIDKSFVDGLPSDPESEAIVGAIIAMATSLRIRLNAEGIERREQATLLQQMGCAEGQGYLFGKPVRAEEIAERMARDARRNRSKPGPAISPGVQTDAPVVSAQLRQVLAAANGTKELAKELQVAHG